MNNAIQTSFSVALLWPRERIRRVELRDPDPLLRVEFQRMAEEFRTAGEARYGEVSRLGAEAFAAYVERLHRSARGEGLERGAVAERTWWLVVAGNIAGVTRLRPRLDPLHERLAGHIGFDVAPSFRSGDTGARLLSLTLVKARDAGLSEVLLCCDPEKTERRRVAAAAGGKMLDEVSGVLPEGDAYRKVRYTIPVP